MPDLDALFNRIIMGMITDNVVSREKRETFALSQDFEDLAAVLTPKARTVFKKRYEVLKTTASIQSCASKGALR